MITSARKRMMALGLILGAGMFVEPVQAAGRLLFDDYYQKPRADGQYGQGVARGGVELRNLTNFYAPDATGIPNGTFAFSALIAEKFAVEISHQPISASRLEHADVYMLVCPVRAEHGGRADLSAADADVLAEFVAQGGSLVLVANSIPDPGKSGLDFAGLNLIGARFGGQFQPNQTDTLSIPSEKSIPCLMACAM